jgi:hypothetical protein
MTLSPETFEVVKAARFEMKLNKSIPRAAMLAVALMALHPAGQAGTVTTQNGSECMPYGWSTSQNLFYGTNGTSNNSPETMSVVCPVTRVGEVSDGGLRVWIDGFVYWDGEPVTCQLWSFDYTGALLGYEGFSATETGASFDKAIVLTKAQVPMYSSQVVVCTLPRGSAIYDIEPEIL